MASELKDLAVSLYDIGVLKFGEFTSKVGLKQPVYFDIRVVISHPKILHKVSTALWKLSGSCEGIDQICGVPYTALPFATVISLQYDIPMLIRRKKAKPYGTKKLIEGTFKAGDSCVIIEDVIMSGGSILEVARDLRSQGLVVNEAYSVLDREQGGKHNIEICGIKVKSLFTLTQFMQYLFEAGKVTSKDVIRIESYLREFTAPVVKTIEPDNKNKRMSLDFSFRADLSRAKKPLASKLLELMDKKSTTLCLAADYTKSQDILELADWAGPHIAVLKIHVEIIEDFDQNFINQLKNLSKMHKFFLMEGRMFIDIGNTVKLQYSKGIYRISEWADFVTVHSIAGSEVIKALEEAFINQTEERGIFLVTEMSSQDESMNESYVQEIIKIGENSDVVVGFLCQSTVFSNPCLIQMTPGVKLTDTCDNSGQWNNTLENVVNSGADLVVVGQVITEASDKFSALLQYKEQLWAAYNKRLKCY